MNAWFVHYNSYNTDGTLLLQLYWHLTNLGYFHYNLCSMWWYQKWHKILFSVYNIWQCCIVSFGISKNNPFSVMAYFCSIHVNMQHNHVHMKQTYVNMPDNHVNMRHKSCMYVDINHLACVCMCSNHIFPIICVCTFKNSSFNFLCKL